MDRISSIFGSSLFTYWFASFLTISNNPFTFVTILRCLSLQAIEAFIYVCHAWFDLVDIQLCSLFYWLWTIRWQSTHSHWEWQPQIDRSSSSSGNHPSDHYIGELFCYRSPISVVGKMHRSTVSHPHRHKSNQFSDQRLLCALLLFLQMQKEGHVKNTTSHGENISIYSKRSIDLFHQTAGLQVSQDQILSASTLLSNGFVHRESILDELLFRQWIAKTILFQCVNHFLTLCTGHALD